MYETKTSQHNFNYGICRVSVSALPRSEHNSPLARHRVQTPAAAEFSEAENGIAPMSNLEECLAQ